MVDGKKAYALVVIGALALFATLVYFDIAKKNVMDQKNSVKENVEDAEKFEKEYESFNGKKIEGNNNTYLDIDITSKNPIEYTSAKDIVKLLKSGTGIIYFGFPTCPWCRNAVPVLLEAAKEEGVKSIYYLNAKDMRDDKILDEKGNVVTNKEGTKEYKGILTLLKDQLPSYEGLKDDSIKRLYFPTVVFVKEGKVIGFHEGTIDSQLDGSVPLTEKQKNELKEIYTKSISLISGEVCDKKC